MASFTDDPTNLIINFLPPSVDEDYLTQLFSPYGSIEKINIVRDRKDNHSLGYGFVKYESADDANSAVQQINGFQIMGKTIRVAVARNREVHSAKPNVYIAGMPPHWTEKDLQAAFQSYGTIQHTKILRNMDTGQSRGAGFVHYSTTEEATAAIKCMNNVVPEDGVQALTVKFGQKQQENKSAKSYPAAQQQQQQQHPAAPQQQHPVPHSRINQPARYAPYGMRPGGPPGGGMMGGAGYGRGRGRGNPMGGGMPPGPMRGNYYGGGAVPPAMAAAHSGGMPMGNPGGNAATGAVPGAGYHHPYQQYGY